MKLITYITYFYFLLDNWDLKIAWYIIKQERKGERKYGINTTGADDLTNLEKLGIDVSHSSVYMPVSYPFLEEIFMQLPDSVCNHFLDIGCGKGRAICMAAHFKFNKVSGIDLSKELCDTAKKNLQLTKRKYPYLDFTVIHNDAFYFEIPCDTNCIFFFNPFDEIIMSGVVKNIYDSLVKNPRKMSIIYINPLYKELFIEAGFKQTWYSKKMTYLEAVILTK